MKILQIHSAYSTSKVSGENSTVDLIAEALTSRFEVVTLIKSTANLGRHPLKEAKNFLSLDVELLEFGLENDLILYHNLIPYFSVPSLLELGRNIPVIRVWHNYRNLCIKGTEFRNGKNCQLCSGKLGRINGIARSCYRNSLGQSIVVSESEKKLADLRNSDKNHHISVSKFVAERMMKSGIIPDRISIIPNFVPPLGSGEIINKRNGDFLFVSRLSEEKGLKLLLDAWVGLSPSVRKLHSLNIVGDGPLYSLKGVYKDSSILFHGPLTALEIEEVASSCTVGLMLPIWGEPFGKVLYEYMSLGLRQIVTPMGEPKHHVMTLPAGIVLRDTSVGALREAIEYFIDHPQFSQQQIIDHYESKNSKEEWVARWQDEIQSIHDRALFRN